MGAYSPQTTMAKLCIGYLLIWLTVAAQADAQEFPTVEIAGGYSFLHSESAPLAGLPDMEFIRHSRFEQAGKTLPLGWGVSASAYINRWLGGTGELNLNFGKYESPLDVPRGTYRLRILSVIAGPEACLRQNRYSICGHYLLGKQQINLQTSQIQLGSLNRRFEGSQTLFVSQPGGNVNFRITRRIAMRGSFNYRQVRWSPGYYTREFQIASGLVFALR